MVPDGWEEEEAGKEERLWRLPRENRPANLWAFLLAYILNLVFINLAGFSKLSGSHLHDLECVKYIIS